MKRGTEIRPMRIDDLRDVFLLGRDVLPSAGRTADRGWNERDLAELLVRGLDVSLVAICKKRVAGFLIAFPEDAESGGAVTVRWLCASPFHGAGVREDLLNAFRQSMAERNCPLIRAEVSAGDADFYEFFRKFGFTESEHLIMMENFPLQKEG